MRTITVVGALFLTEVLILGYLSSWAMALGCLVGAFVGFWLGAEPTYVRIAGLPLLILSLIVIWWHMNKMKKIGWCQRESSWITPGGTEIQQYVWVQTFIASACGFIVSLLLCGLSVHAWITCLSVARPPRRSPPNVTPPDYTRSRNSVIYAGVTEDFDPSEHMKQVESAIDATPIAKPQISVVTHCS